MKSNRSRGSSVYSKRPGSLPPHVGASQDDKEPPLSPELLNNLLLSLIDHHNAPPVEVVEIASDLLLDRYVEFVSKTLLVRTFEGAKDAGEIIQTITGSPSITVIHYQDTDFFQVLESDVSLILCVSMGMPSWEFSKLLEETLGAKIVELPQMMTNVRLEFTAIESVWQLVAVREQKELRNHKRTSFLREKKGQHHSSESKKGGSEKHSQKSDDDDDDEDEDGMHKKNIPSYAQEVLRDTTALSNNILVVKGKNPSFYIDHFCLLFESNQSLASLQQALVRAKEQLEEYDMNHRLSHAQPLAVCLTSLLNVLTKPMHPSLSDEVCVVASTIATTLIGENMQVACIPQMEVMLSSLIHLLGASKWKRVSTAMKGFFSTILSLITSCRFINVTEHSHLAGNYELISDVVVILVRSARETMEGILPSDSADVKMSAERLKELVTFDDGDGHGNRPGQLSSASGFKQSRKQTPGHGGEAYLNSLLGFASSSFSSSRKENAAGHSTNFDDTQDKGLPTGMLRAISVLFPGCVTCIDIVIDTLNKLICEGMEDPSGEVGTPEDVEGKVEYIKENGRALMEELISLAIASLRCLWFLNEEDTARFLVLCTPTISCIFRRMSSWVAALSDESSWFAAVQCSITHVLAKALAVKQKSQLQFVHHQWVIRICVSCGPSSERAVLSEFHRFFCMTKRFAAVFDPGLLEYVWKDVHNFCLNVADATPSPSNARAMWESVCAATECYVKVSKDRFDATPQRNLATIIYTSVVDVGELASNSDQNLKVADDLLEDSAWNGYDDFFSDQRMQINTEDTSVIPGVSATEMASMSGPLYYVLDLLESEKKEERWRSFGMHCLKLAEALSNLRAPHSIGSLFVHAGIRALAESFTGNNDHEVLAVLCDQYEAILYRWVNVKTAFSAIDAAKRILTLEDESPDRFFTVAGSGEDPKEGHNSSHQNVSNGNDTFGGATGHQRRSSAHPTSIIDQDARNDSYSVSLMKRKKPSVLDELHRSYVN